MYAEQACTSVIYTCPYTILQIAIFDHICIYLSIFVYMCIYLYMYIYIYMIHVKQPLMPFLGITLSSVEDPRAHLLGE